MRGNGLQYVSLDIVRYAAGVLSAAEAAGQPVGCEAEEAGHLCGRPVEYLIPSGARPGGGGQDIEQRPTMVCRAHLEEMLGHPPEEQPLFRRLSGPDS